MARKPLHAWAIIDRKTGELVDIDPRRAWIRDQARWHRRTMLRRVRIVKVEIRELGRG